MQLWNADLRPVGQPIRQELPVSVIEFSHDGEVVATGSDDGTVRLWDSDTGAPIGQPMKGTGYVTSISFSDDGRLLAVGGSFPDLQLWDTGSSQAVGDPMQLDSAVNDAAFSPDSRTVASGSVDGAIQLWDIHDQSQFGAPLTGHQSMVTTWTSARTGRSCSRRVMITRFGLAGAAAPDAAPDALCAKLTHNMSPDQWNNGLARDRLHQGLPRTCQRPNSADSPRTARSSSAEGLRARRPGQQFPNTKKFPTSKSKTDCANQ